MRHVRWKSYIFVDRVRKEAADVCQLLQGHRASVGCVRCELLAELQDPKVERATLRL